MAQAASSLKHLAATHEELQASSQAKEVALQSLRAELSTQRAEAQQLQQQLHTRGSQLQKTQLELQQKSDAHSELESQLTTRAAELVVMAKQRTRLEADMMQLQQEAAKGVSSAKDEIRQLQVNCNMAVMMEAVTGHMIMPCWPLLLH